MNRLNIYKGYVFLDGEYNEYTVLNRNDGGLVYCEKWHPGNYSGNPVALTLEEIQRLMKSYDGKSYQVKFVYRYLIILHEANTGVDKVMNKFVSSYYLNSDDIKGMIGEASVNYGVAPDLLSIVEVEY